MSDESSTANPRPQATEVNYELHTLGWKAFQNLCSTILGEVWGQTIQGFFDSKDGGRDGAFYGEWKPKANERHEGTFTVQCKFTAKADRQLALTDLKDELEKAARLAAKGLSKSYFLLTNARLTGSTDEKIREAFLAIDGIHSFAAFGVERISQIIRESARLRMLVPRIYGLGDLSQILDERAQEQSREILSSLGDDLSKFVITQPFRRSARALVDHGFVLLLGEPACGKSTIAAALALGALDEWGCGTFKIRNADDFIRHSNPHEPKQFFWVDDAFGATQLDWSSVSEWNHAFTHINAAIRRGARVVFTSRDYIYQSARSLLKESALPVFRESQVVIHVEKLTCAEREQILYNHIRLGRQPSDFKRRAKPFLPSVAVHNRFSPEIARRLAEPIFTKSLVLSASGLDAFVEKSVALLCEIVRTMDQASRSALALVFMRGGYLASPVTMTGEEERAVSLMGGTPSSVREALNALNGSLVLQVSNKGLHAWQFKHPTVRDAFAELLSEDRELLDIYISGAPIVRIFGEVTCGDVGIKGAKVVIPNDRYPALLVRLKDFDASKWDSKWQLCRFLTHRCDDEFLAAFVNDFAPFVDALSVYSYLAHIPDAALLARLNRLKLLPEEKRLKLVEAIKECAVETPDAGFLEEEMRDLFAEGEIEAILQELRDKLLPDLESTVRKWKSDFSFSDGREPSTYFSDLEEALRGFQEALADDSESWELIETACSNIKEAIDDLEQDRPFEPDSDDFRAGLSGNEGIGQDRSIFDDVDE